MVEEGLSLCKEYLKDRPQDGKMHSLAGVLFIKKKAVPEAISEFKEQIELGHHPELGYVNLGMALAMKESWDEAITAYKKALELNDRNPRAHYQLAVAYEKKGLKEEAQKEQAIYRELTGK